jgi:hypothetical protein
LEILLGGFYDHWRRYQESPKAALELIRIGESPRNDKPEVSELAAYTAVASLILNLDEAITKE